MNQFSIGQVHAQDRSRPRPKWRATSTRSARPVSGSQRKKSGGGDSRRREARRAAVRRAAEKPVALPSGQPAMTRTTGRDGRQEKGKNSCRAREWADRLHRGKNRGHGKPTGDGIRGSVQHGSMRSALLAHNSVSVRAGTAYRTLLIRRHHRSRTLGLIKTTSHRRLVDGRQTASTAEPNALLDRE
jgi:hypothetical protein